MGNCTATQATMPAISNPNGVAKVIHVDGRLQEFRRPVKAGQVMAENPNYFLCSSESMDVDVPLASVGEDEVLQPDQMYFLIPRANLHTALSLTDLCELAIKASIAIRKEQEGQAPEVMTSTLLLACGVSIPVAGRNGRQIQVGPTGRRVSGRAANMKSVV